MKPETQQKLNALIEANIAQGFARGQELFTESLEEDLQKSAILQESSVEGVIEYLMQDYINRNLA